MNNFFTKIRDYLVPSEADDGYSGYGYDTLRNDPYTKELYPDHEDPLVGEDETIRRRTSMRNPRPVTESEIGVTVGNPSMRENNVIGMPRPANGVPEVVIMEPRSFEEMPQAIQALRERKSVVLNLNMMDPDQAQRAVDFVAGGTYAIDGHQERIGESIFLFTPNCVQVSTQSGIAHEVPQPQMRTPRPPAPAPAWTEATSMMA